MGNLMIPLLAASHSVLFHCSRTRGMDDLFRAHEAGSRVIFAGEIYDHWSRLSPQAAL